MLVHLNRYCSHLLTQFGEDKFIDVTSSSQKPDDKIRKHNGDDILISSGKSRKSSIVYSASMSLKEAVREVELKMMFWEEKFKKWLWFSAKRFLGKKNRITKNSKLSDIEEGEIAISGLISIFFQNWLLGQIPDDGKEVKRQLGLSHYVRI